MAVMRIVVIRTAVGENC